MDGCTGLKAQHGSSYKTVSGEGKNADAAVVSDWTLTLPAPVSQYRPQDVFDADEAGVFINLQPEQSLSMKGEMCRAKKSEERVTVFFCCNADESEKLKLTVIGKFWKPHCFSHNPPLPVIYKANKKAWMTGAFFKEFLTVLDSKMCAENRKILLFLDNCAAHPVDVGWLRNMSNFLTTQHHQPLAAPGRGHYENHDTSFSKLTAEAAFSQDPMKRCQPED